MLKLFINEACTVRKMANQSNRENEKLPLAENIRKRRRRNHCFGARVEKANRETGAGRHPLRRINSLRPSVGTGWVDGQCLVYLSGLDGAGGSVFEGDWRIPDRASFGYPGQSGVAAGGPGSRATFVKVMLGP